MVRSVISRGCHGRHGAATFGVGAHGHEHALDIRVMNDGAASGERAVHRAALHAVLGKLHSLLVRPLGNRNALHAHGVARRIHHDEHVLEAPVFLAHQVTHGATMVSILQHGGRAGLDAQLVLDAHAMHIVTRARRAVGLHHELGHHKQADAFHAFGRAGHTGQHQVHNVLGHVVLTVGDVDLGAEHFVSAVRLRLCAAAHSGQVRAGLRLSQVHGASPLTADQFLKVGGFELVRAGRQQRLDSAVGQQRAQGKAHIR